MVYPASLVAFSLVTSMCVSHVLGAGGELLVMRIITCSGSSNKSIVVLYVHTLRT